VVVRALTWNLFHGRDHPPEPGLHTWRSRLLRVTERGERYAQVNRPLRREFGDVLARLEWDVALLQEAPPRWLEPLGERLGAEGVMALTSRNSLAPLRALGARLNPDLIASNEGGSNQLLVRPPWRVDEVRRHTTTQTPERRVLLWARLREPDGRALCVGNLHGSTPGVPSAGAEVLDAAARAVDWAGGAPLVFGGDLNQRPDRHARTFDELERRFDLVPPSAPGAIDHLLFRDLDVQVPPRVLPASARDVRTGGGLLLQLSDHPCVAATAGMK
jgi:endonuclease/exonuclease/phosphatase family metal-dependent hydrolase